MFTGDDRTRLIVERSGGEVKPLSKLEHETRVSFHAEYLFSGFQIQNDELMDVNL